MGRSYEIFSYGFSCNLKIFQPPGLWLNFADFDPYATSTQIRNVWNPCVSDVSKWRIRVEVKDFLGLKRVTLVWKWRVGVTWVWKWGVLKSKILVIEPLAGKLFCEKPFDDI